MQRVLILGATGLLGSALYDVLRHRYSLTLAMRDVGNIALLEHAYGGTNAHDTIAFDANYITDKSYYDAFLETVGAVDYVINAIGITARYAEKNPASAFLINGDLPHVLANTFGPRLIHIATNGVYDGTKGPYAESSPQSPIGVYAESKSRGEPKTCLTLRTSIIGRELEGNTSFLEWFLQQKEKSIKGYRGHLWNGITAREFANVCDRIMSHAVPAPMTGIYHIFSTTLSKYDMLLAFRDQYNIDCEIVPDDSQVLDQTLATVHQLNHDLHIPSFTEMLTDLHASPFVR